MVRQVLRERRVVSQQQSRQTATSEFTPAGFNQKRKYKNINISMFVQYGWLCDTRRAATHTYTYIMRSFTVPENIALAFVPL